MHKSQAVSIPLDQKVLHHTDHGDLHAWRVAENDHDHGGTYLRGNVTQLVEFGERCIRAGIEHASDLTPEAVWVEYLSVMLDRAQADAARASRERFPNLPWDTAEIKSLDRHLALALVRRIALHRPISGDAAVRFKTDDGAITCVAPLDDAERWVREATDIEWEERSDFHNLALTGPDGHTRRIQCWFSRDEVAA